LSLAARAVRGFLIGFVLPLVVVAISYLPGGLDSMPGAVTLQWLVGLGLVNCVFLVGGPILWDALCVAGDEVDDAVTSAADIAVLNAWIHRQYRTMRWQVLTTLGGGVFGVLLLLALYFASDRAFTIGYGECFAMFETAALASNGLWILWWIVDLIGVVGASRSLVLWWHDPARSYVIVALNRALWKTGFAIMLGMVALAIAVGGLPATAFTTGAIRDSWWLVVLVQYIAFAIVGTIFFRDAVWGQWQIFRIVRRYIDTTRAEVDASFLASSPLRFGRGRRAHATVRQLKLHQHFNSLKSVDINLGWALTWSTSIAGAVVSSVVAVWMATPS
jgi:hypothetical protein